MLTRQLRHSCEFVETIGGLISISSLIINTFPATVTNAVPATAIATTSVFGADPDVTRSIRQTLSTLSREEEKLAASKDYSGAAKLNDEAKTLSSLAAAVEELEVRERSLAVAKDYTGAQAASEETNALRLRALAEVDRIRRASLGGEYTTPNPLGTSFLSQQHGVPVAVADAINGAPESTEMER